MSEIKALRRDTLSQAESTQGIVRHLAFKGEGHQILRIRTDPGAVSGWHHHGDYDVYGYIASGTARIESGPGGKNAISLGTGDFIHVPRQTVHRDVNPSTHERQEIILFLRGTGPPVVNVDGPDEQ